MANAAQTLTIAIWVAVTGLSGRALAEVFEIELVGENAELSSMVPLDDSEDATWRDIWFDDSAWLIGTLGIGFDSSWTNYGPYLKTDLLAEMRYESASNYIRIPFEGPGLTIQSLRLRMRYDDGFVAYINGVRIASDHAPDVLDFESLATNNHPDVLAVQFVDFDVSAAADAVVPGTNILAIHGMNQSIVSADYLIDARLVAEVTEQPIPTTIEPIASVERVDGGIRFTMPPEFVCAHVVMQYSLDMSEGSWADIGTFEAADFITPSFVDSETARIERPSGYYRAVLRPPL